MAPVYLVDVAAYKPPDEYKVVATDVSGAFDEGKFTKWGALTEDAANFVRKIFEKSGLSATGTYLPPSIHPMHANMPRNDLSAAREEAEMVMITAVQDLLDKTGLKAADIGILVTCCSIYCPTPSTASMLVNHFKMRDDVQSYHLGGMGCGTGVVAINLLKDLLQAHPDTYAVFVPSEITSYCYYSGVDKTRMVSNAIFRMGGAAVLLTNKKSARHTAKYELLHHERVHTGASDAAYQCMSWSPDSQGINGVFLSKTVVTQAGLALRECLVRITPRILTWRQFLTASLALGHARAKRLASWLRGTAVTDVAEAGPALEYVPDFTQCVDHFAIHAGGYAVLKGVQAGMKLPNSTMLPSFAALRDYGNTSCSTTWYVLAYLESCGGVKRGQRIMQIGMGGGMKVGINIWQALRDVRETHPAWAHLDGQALTEDELPRNIEAVGGPSDTAAAVTASGKPALCSSPPGQLSASLNGKACDSVHRKISVDLMAKAAETVAVHHNGETYESL